MNVFVVMTYGVVDSIWSRKSNADKQKEFLKDKFKLNATIVEKSIEDNLQSELRTPVGTNAIHLKQLGATDTFSVFSS